MHFLLSLIIGGILLFLITRALFETVIGLSQLLIGLLLHAIAYLLDATAWAIRASKSLWRTAFG